MNKCPCIDCICVPVCRHKLYGYLFRDCVLITNYMPKYDVVHLRDEKKMKTIIKILQPTYWKYKIDTSLNTKFPIVSYKGTNEDLKNQLRERR